MEMKDEDEEDEEEENCFECFYVSNSNNLHVGNTNR